MGHQGGRWWLDLNNDGLINQCDKFSWCSKSDSELKDLAVSSDDRKTKTNSLLNFESNKKERHNPVL